MEAVVQQCSVDKQCFEIYKKELFLDNDRLLHQIMSQDVLLTVMNSTTVYGDFVNLEMQSSESCDKCFDLDAEILKKQNAYNERLKSYSQIEKHCISLELSIQLNQEIFQKEKSCDNQNALKIPKYFENDNLKAQLQVKGTTIRKEIVDNAAQIPNATTIVLGMFKLDLNPLAPRLLKNRDADIDYLKYTQEQADILRGIVKQAKEKQPLDNALDFACKHAKRIQELLVYVRDTCPYANKPSEKLVDVTPMNKVKKVRIESSTSASRSQPTGNKKNDRISQTPSSNMKNKVVQIVLWCLDSGCSKHMTRNRSQLMNFISKFLGTVRFRNDQIAKIMGYGD
ncbi:hypothetical protein Tco_0888426 [Tanacetum coccineum]